MSPRSLEVDSSAQQITISWTNLSWTFAAPISSISQLDTVCEAFSSWLSEQSALDSSLRPLLDSATFALTFLSFIVQRKIWAKSIVSVLDAFEKHFLDDEDIHTIALRLPGPFAKDALKNYYAATTTAKRIGRLANSALLKAATEEKANLCAVFGGQGPSNSTSFHDLRELHLTYQPHLAELISIVARTIHTLATAPEVSYFYEDRGFEIERWLQDPSLVPDPDYIAAAPISFPLIGLLALCHYRLACSITGRTPGEMRRLMRGTTGHSQGIIIAAVISRSESWEDFYNFTRLAIELLFWIGFESHHEMSAPSLSAGAITDCMEKGEGRPTPMLKIRGLEIYAVTKLIDDANAYLPASEQIYLALTNSRDNLVVAGPPRSLRGLCLRLRKIRAEENVDQSRLPFAERRPSVRHQFLPISAAFHSPILEDVAARVQARFPSACWLGSELGISLYHTGTGEDLKERDSENILPLLIRMVTTEPVNWPRAFSFPKVSHILDFGPGRIGYLIQEMVEGSGVRVIVASDMYSFSDHIGCKAELFAPNLPPSTPNWRREYRPKLIKSSSGEVVLDTKMTRLLGCPPVMVAGMTPTTVPWQFCLAVIKAGYHVELGGGGYFKAIDFEKAVHNLSCAMPMGCGITCNLIYADPKAIAWQIPLIRQLIRRGYPIDGLTIGAGVPSEEVAAEYIETLGVKHVSFKPGSHDAIMAVIDIARSHPNFPIGLQWTGGRGGGHHSFEDFHEPILKAYGKIRECANIVLIAGSGFGSAEDSYPYMTGDWSRVRGYPSMPFDGVLLGSRMMVAKEAFTSQQAKELIVQARGVPNSQWHQTYQQPAGGVITIQSEMGQPIHKLATRGVMLWHELDRTIFSIKDPSKRLMELQTRRIEIVERLNKDYQRPWFAVNARGESVDVEDLTYMELIQRLVHLVYVQHQERWVDMSYQRLVLDFTTRAEGRLGASAHFTLADLNDPFHFFDRFSSRYPNASSELVGDEDASFFVGLCKRRGQKPVNFIPRLDENFEHWFKKDSLWQAEDVDAVIDQDAQRVCIIQGPVAVQYSTRADESTQNILDGISKKHVEMVRRDFYSNRSITTVKDSMPSANLAFSSEQVEGVSIVQAAKYERYEFRNSGKLPAGDAFIAHLSSRLVGWAKACLVDSLITCGRDRRTNFIPSLFNPRHHQVIKIDYNENKTIAGLSVSNISGGSEKTTTVARLESFDGKRILVTFYSPSPFTEQMVDLRFEYDFLPDKSWCRIYEDTTLHNARVKSFYAQLWIGSYPSSLRLARLDDEFTGKKTFITHNMAQSFLRVANSTKGNEVAGISVDGVVPLDLGVALAWEALVKPLLISKIDGDLLQLLHFSNKFEYCPGARPLRVGDEVESTSRIQAVTIQSNGKLVEVAATISRYGEPVMTVTSVFMFQGSFSDHDGTFRWTKEQDMKIEVDTEKMKALLLSRSWLSIHKDAEDLLGKTVLVKLETRTTLGPTNAIKGLRVRGQLCLHNSPEAVGEVHFEAGLCHGNPVSDFFNRHGSLVDQEHPLSTPGWEGLSSWKIRVPQNNKPYARVSKDTNPIHVSPVFAAYAQLPGTVTHGMLTSAIVRQMVESAAAEADCGRFRSWSTTFEGIVLPGDELRVEMQHVAMAQGNLVLKVQAFNHATGDRVLHARAEVEQAPTAYVFTGQGSQEKGMGMHLYDSSEVAWGVWEKADKHLRNLYGFSILHIVRDNPKSITVYFGGRRGQQIRHNYLALKTQSPNLQSDESAEACVIAGLNEDSPSYTFYHERGLLESTQFAQPALTIMEMAAFEDMKSKGLVQSNTLFAGHSLGEYAALGAVAEFLPLESLLSLVFYRGLAMQVAMKRDGEGRTDFSMMAVNPERIRKGDGAMEEIVDAAMLGFTEEAFEELVTQVARETGVLLEVVNYNVEGQQYVCAGHLRALWILTETCNAFYRSSSSSLPTHAETATTIRSLLPRCQTSTASINLQRGAATIPLRGIDVPFHSKYLRGGIDSYRKVLEEKIVEGSVDPAQLAGKWIPNVMGKVFGTERGFVEEVQRVTESDVLSGVLADVN
ncbi:MAG: hypothetical protein Q9202_005879 [Teloschistes flavicans]